MEPLLEKALIQAEEFRAKFVREECRSVDDLVVLAVALMEQAKTIYRAIGGERNVVAQLTAEVQSLGVPMGSDNTMWCQ